MLRRIVTSACLAGLVAGAVLTIAQQPQVIPLIAEAETYETATPAALPHSDSHTHADGVTHAHPHSHEHGASHAHSHTAAGASGHAPSETTTTHSHATHSHDDAAHAQAPHAHGHAASGHHHDADAWAPEDGLERTFWTLVSNVGAAIGFALLLCALYAVRPSITPLKGLLWGVAGYVVFFANPSIGLHPELPGTMAANLGDRQLWWLLTAACSAAAIGLFVLRREPLAWVAGIGLLLLPHLFGAPQPDAHGGLAPAELYTQFMWATAIANAVFWLTLGVSSAYAFRRLSPPASAA